MAEALNDPVSKFLLTCALAILRKNINGIYGMIICVVPRGLQGKGGIERLFAHIDRLGAIPGIRFVTSRGDKSFAWSLGVFALAIPQSGGEDVVCVEADCSRQSVDVCERLTANRY